jgi:phosphoserine phosphatase RsbU/P
MPDTCRHTSQLQVLLLSADRDEACESLRVGLRTEGLQSAWLPAADYSLRAIAPSGVGAAIVDMRGLNEGQQEAVHAILNRLNADGVPITLLNARSDSFADIHGLISRVDNVTTDMLVGMAMAHLAVRKAGLDDRKAETDTTEQLQMAGRVQRDFLPARLPDSDACRWATLFRPAEWVSGDIYDIARLDETHIGFYLADAVGHSMPAALLTMFLKHGIVMRESLSNSYRIFEPVEVITRLNVLMTEQGLSGCQFATICYCLLNIKTRELRFARAGHPYPVLMGADGKVRTLECRGPLLGVFADSVFGQETVTLAGGDKLLLYSDGAEGLIGSAGQTGTFEFTPLVTAMAGMPVDGMMKHLEDAAERYEFADGLKDDVTAIGLQVL